MKKPFTSFKKRSYQNNKQDFKKQPYKANTGDFKNQPYKSKSKMGDTKNQYGMEEDKQISEEIFDLTKMAESKIFKLKPHEKNFTRQGFMTNFHEVTILDEEETTISALMLSVLDSGGDWFTCYVKYEPYFYLKVKPGSEIEIMNFLEKLFEGKIQRIIQVQKQDLDLINHLSGIQATYLKLFFRTNRAHKDVRMALQKVVRKNKFHKTKKSFLGGRGIGQLNSFNIERTRSKFNNYESTEAAILSQIEDIREHDINYLVRVAIDKNLRAGKWYNIVCNNGFVVSIENEPTLLEIPELGILAYDIETTKQPLKFPDSQIDEVMLISYVVDGEACLVVNRNIISKDITEFNYAPKKDIDYDIVIFNEADERATIQRFFDEIVRARPMVLTTYNGDNFDWPFLEDRALIHDIDMTSLLGIKRTENLNRTLLSKKFMGQVIFTHLDCYHWVKRDAYLPQGSHGLKKVTKAKLGYNPIEVDPEMMVPLASSDPQRLCEYSVSDAVATYHLYKKHIHDFILALCTIVPLNPEMILRHGSGVLCENLLMAQAYSENIVFPSKKYNNKMKFYNNHPIDIETYIGGYVQCINEGVYRADIKTNFKLDPDAYSKLIGQSKEVLDFFIEKESGCKVEDIENYQEVLEDIKSKLWGLQRIAQQEGERKMLPLIYHVDVAAMYPNIILTNRLQPTAIVNDKICCNCIYNKKENECKRKLGWEYKVTYFPLSKKEYQVIEAENRQWNIKEKMDNVVKAVKMFSAKNYKKMRETVVEKREDVICMRENSFYVDTIRDFRDRRYRFKALTKVHSRKSRAAKGQGQFETATEEGNLATLYDSLQLAHKIILNSFYGYVMKKSARWFSMEMAAMVTYTGAKIIQSARDLLEKVGKVLELDTDGVWTLFPKGFPEKYEIKTKQGKTLHFGYPCSLMNHLIYDMFKNTQYQDKVAPKKYSKRTEMSIYFELDGPYRAMFIPASHEENKKLKKKYCVFNFDGSISEIKGFELKRRGELEIIKKFQKEIFGRFLDGSDLSQCYKSCAETAQRWLDIILRKGEDMNENSLFELIGESKVLSKNISDYGTQKAVALTAAKRMAQYLGNINVFQSAGMRLDFIISREPETHTVSQRAIPISVFKLPHKTKIRFLREWLGFPEKEKNFELRNIIDWDYYFVRFSKNIQKLITIPAVLQGLNNPLKDVPNPVWLQKKLRARNNNEKQTAMTSFFTKKPKTLKDVEQLFGDLHLLDKENVEKKPSKIVIEQAPEKEKEEKVEMKGRISISSTLPGNSKFGRFNIKLLKQRWKSKFKKTRTQDKPVKIDNIKDMTKYIGTQVENSSWKVLKINQFKLGEYQLHIVVNKRYMQQVVVSTNRKIFVNFYKDQQNDKWKLSRKKLPRDKAAWYMYQIDFTEEVFSTDFKDLAFFLSNVDVEGVYESQMDLGFLLLRDLGMRCAIQKQFRDSLHFDPNEKVFKLESASLYKDLDVNTSSSNVQRVFGDSVFATRGLNFALVWGIRKGNKTGVFIWGNKKSTLILHGSTSWLAEKKAKVEFKQFLQNSVDKLSADRFDLPSDVVYSSELQLRDGEEDLETCVCNTLEASIPKASSSPSMIVCSFNDELFAKVNPESLELWFGVPVVSIRIPKEQHSSLSLNSLTWHKTLAKQGIKQLPSFENLVLTLDRLASFSQLPLGNLHTSLSSSLVQAMDVIFSRKLEALNYLSWFSKKGVPDLGQMGLIQGEHENLLEDCDEDNPHMNDNFNSRSIVQPGFYVTYVVEINLRMFIMNALINTGCFEESDYVERYNLKPNHHQKYLNPNLNQAGEGLHNLAAFKIIKELLVSWYQKIKTEKDASADLLITNLMVWMVSEDSKFFDPVVKKRFLKIVTKAFDQLLVKVDELGGKVVMASHEQLLIDTNLVDIESASNFRKYIINNIRQDTSFKYMAISEGKSFPLLIIHNKFDYIGVICTNPSSDYGKGGELNFEIDCIFRMHLCLPQEMRVLFCGLMEFFVNSVHLELRNLEKNKTEQTGKELKNAFMEKMKKFLDEQFLSNIFQSVDYIKENLAQMELDNFHQNKILQGKRPSETGNISCQSDFGKAQPEQAQFYVGPDTVVKRNQTQPVIEEESIQEEMQDSFLDEDEYENDSFVEDEDLEAGQVGQMQIKKEVGHKKKKLPCEEEDEFSGWRRKDMLGQSRKLGSLEVEFINLLFEVLTAGKEESGGIMQLAKKNVIFYMEKDFYSEEAKFRPLMISFMIHEVKCGNCRTVTSLDIFRAPEQSKSDERIYLLLSPYQCICSSYFEKKAIEKKIILKLAKQIQKCLGQELYCEKCLLVKKGIFEESCCCTGKFMPRDSELKNNIHQELANGLINFRRLANSYNMKKLRRFVENLVF